MIDSKLKDVRIDLRDYANKSSQEKADLIATARKTARIHGTPEEGQ